MSWNIEQRWGFEPYRLKKNFFFKKTSKSFGGSKKSLTFASAFGTEVFKEEFFERFRYEQASSTRLVNEEWIMKN